ncbi:UNVERIFIED_CONTAM: hypothetical protein FKN15_072821 [Acipenser sinensis]
MGLGYEDIKKVAPQIVYSSITVPEASWESLPAVCDYQMWRVTKRVKHLAENLQSL